MYAIITGCGRLGTGVAKALAEKGHDVVIVDEEADLHLVGDGFDGLVMEGSPVDSKVLISAGIKKAELLVAATADDRKNILTVQLAVEMFHVPKAIARVSDPALSDFYHEQGLSTVCPTATGINQVMASIQGELFSSFAGKIDPDTVAIIVPDNWAGIPISRIDLGLGQRLIGVISCGRVRVVDPKRQLKAGDTVLLWKEGHR